MRSITDLAKNKFRISKGSVWPTGYETVWSQFMYESHVVIVQRENFITNRSNGTVCL